MCAMYVPNFIIFFIGAALCIYHVNPIDRTGEIKCSSRKLGSAATSQQITDMAASFKPADYGDKVLPHFMVIMFRQD